MSKVYKALSDPTRRKMLDLLSAQDMSAGQIASHFTISAPSVSHHLSILYEAGLVDRDKRGQQITYSLNTTVLQDVFSWLLGLQEKHDE